MSKRSSTNSPEGTPANKTNKRKGPGDDHDTDLLMNELEHEEIPQSLIPVRKNKMITVILYFAMGIDTPWGLSISGDLTYKMNQQTSFRDAFSCEFYYPYNFPRQPNSNGFLVPIFPFAKAGWWKLCAKGVDVLGTYETIKRMMEMGHYDSTICYEYKVETCSKRDAVRIIRGLRNKEGICNHVDLTRAAIANTI